MEAGLGGRRVVESAWRHGSNKKHYNIISRFFWCLNKNREPKEIAVGMTSQYEILWLMYFLYANNIFSGQL